MIRLIYKYQFLSIVTFVEILFVLFFYLSGHHGWFALMRLKEEKKELQADISALNERIRDIKNAIADFNTSDFPKEKIAREQLHMAKPQEIVVYLSER